MNNIFNRNNNLPKMKLRLLFDTIHGKVFTKKERYMKSIITFYICSLNKIFARKGYTEHI